MYAKILKVKIKYFAESFENPSIHPFSYTNIPLGPAGVLVTISSCEGARGRVHPGQATSSW